MYKILADDTLIYDSTLDDYTITKGQISKEVNKAGSFIFTIYPTHPFYNRIQRLKTIITVLKGDKIIFRGRVLNDQLGFYKGKTFTCEGELAFLHDSIQRPYAYNGGPDLLFTQLVNNHNELVDSSKQFKVGEITVTDPNNYINRANSKYESTYDNVNSKLIDLLGGYLYISRDDEQQAVINYYQDSPFQNGQTIEFGENLLDFVKTNSAEDIGTAIIPLGAKIEGAEGEDDETRLTIAEVNGGKDYLYDPVAVEKYGWIWKTVEYDDVTEAANLLRKGKEYLNEVIKQNTTIELKAIDLSLMDKSIDSFELFEYINIVSEPHGLKDKLLLQKQTIDLLSPENDKITLGYTYSTFTDTTVSQNSTLAKSAQNVNDIANQVVVIKNEISDVNSAINVADNELRVGTDDTLKMILTSDSLKLANLKLNIDDNKTILDSAMLVNLKNVTVKDLNDIEYTSVFKINSTDIKNVPNQNESIVLTLKTDNFKYQRVLDLKTNTFYNRLNNSTWTKEFKIITKKQRLTDITFKNQTDTYFSSNEVTVSFDTDLSLANINIDILNTDEIIFKTVKIVNDNLVFKFYKLTDTAINIDLNITLIF